jgi:hypothetical protein
VQKKILIVLLSPAFFATSCLTSLHTLTTPHNVLVDDRLTGNWLHQQQAVQIQKVQESRYNSLFAEARESQNPFSEQDSLFIIKHYVITARQDGIEYIWIASLTRIRDQTFASLMPDACFVKGQDIAEEAGKGDSYSFAEVRWTGANSVELHFINGDFVRKTILDGKAHIKYEYDPLFGTFVITSSQNQLELFLRKYGKDERLYKGGNLILLHRKGS